jgi:hypothetical protein
MFRQAAVLAGGLLGLLASRPLMAQDAALRLELVQGEQPRTRDISLVTSRDGYLLLLHVASGSVRVMFPVKPGASSIFPSGEYNLDRLGGEIPWANGRGAGIIVAAWSESLIRTDEFVRYGHWAVSDLNRRAFIEDPAAATIALATRLGATPGAAAAVEYGSIGASSQGAPSENQAIRTIRQDGSGSLEWLVYQNLIRIQGRCPSGTRDVTGSGEYCSAPQEAPRASPLRPVTDLPRTEPADRPSRPVYRPPPVNPPPAAAPSRPATPPPSGGKPGKQPL